MPPIFLDEEELQREGGGGRAIESVIRVLVARVGAGPVVESIENTLPAAQRLVGGYVESISLGEGVSLMCNEEGKLRGLMPNLRLPGDLIRGDVFITRTNENGDHVSLTDGDIARYTHWLRLAQVGQ